MATASRRERIRTWSEAGNVLERWDDGLLIKDEDPPGARRWCERAAESGDTGAMFALGLLLAVEDPGRARGWFERATESGHSGAMFALGC